MIGGSNVEMITLLISNTTSHGIEINWHSL